MHYFTVLAVLLVLPVPFVLAVDPHPHCTPGDCGEGEKKGIDGRCIPCDSETFMPFSNHACKSCYICDTATQEGEIKVANCTGRSNAIVTCKADYFNTGGNTPDTRSCLKCDECSDNEYVSRICTETQNTKCIPKITSKAVPDDETTSVRNDLSPSETANFVNKATVNPTGNFSSTSNFSTTAPVKAEGDSSKTVLIIVLSIVMCTLFAPAAVVIYKCRSRMCRKTDYSPARNSPPPPDTHDTELSESCITQDK